MFTTWLLWMPLKDCSTNGPTCRWKLHIVSPPTAVQQQTQAPVIRRAELSSSIKCIKIRVLTGSKQFNHKWTSIYKYWMMLWIHWKYYVGHFWPMGDHSSLNLVLSQLHHWAAQTCHGVRPFFTCTTRLRKDLLSHVLNPKTIPEMVSGCKQTVEVGEVVLLQPMQFSWITPPWAPNRWWV